MRNGKTWRGKAVFGSEETVERQQLDAWQGFAYDILERKAEEFERIAAASGVRGRVAGCRDEEGQGLPPCALQAYKPLRLTLTGPAGTGKSRTIRAAVAARRERAVALGASEAEAGRACLLAAPTGCASFQMKYGATTVHRAFGIQPRKYCGPTVDKQSAHFLERVRRLRAARLYVLDEFSMIGRQQLGRIAFRTTEALPSARREFGREVTLGGRDVVKAGDTRQMSSIGDESFFKEGPYTKDAQNRPRPGKGGGAPEVPPGTPSMAELTALGLMARESFDDVVILRQIFRADRGSESMSEGERQAYVQDLEEFLRVTDRMGDLTWVPGDHAWLSKRNRSALSAEELKEFQEAPMLMDTRKQKRGGGECEDAAGADLMNAQE